MDVTVPFHVCWNVRGPVHSSIFFWNIPSTSMLPSWFARMVHYNLQDMEFNLSLLVKALTICLRSQTFLLLWNAESGLNIVHCSCKLALGKHFLRGALRKFVFNPASKGSLITIKPAPSGFTLHVKHCCTISGIFEGDITSVDQI